MSGLIIPDSGVTLGSSRHGSSKSESSSLPPALGLSLSDSVIEEMIKCVQDGKPIQLSLGDLPNITFGTKTQNLSTSNDPFTHEIFQSNNTTYDKSSPTSETMAFIDRNGKPIKNPYNPPKFFSLFGNSHLRAQGRPFVTRVVKASSTAPSTTSADDVAILQRDMSAFNQRKEDNTTQMIKKVVAPPGKGQASSKKYLATTARLTADSGRSGASSPALSGVASPALGPTSVPLSQQKTDQAKVSRKPVIHLLAIEPMTKRALRHGTPELTDTEFEQALQKVADLEVDKWVLSKKFWRELDVWGYDYANQEDRQKAIDNAVSKFDNLRLGTTEPEWDRLLPKSERGQGKSLSKLQAQIAQGLARPPKIKVQRDDGSGRDTSPGEEEDLVARKALTSKVKKADTSARAASQTPTTKPKKTGETQAKKLLSSKSSKPAASPKPAPAVPTKRWNSAKQAKAAAAKVLSSEFVGDSDEEEEPSRKPTPKPLSTKKRPRDEEIESSDSSVPLSKKMKKDAPAPHRVSNTSQSTNPMTSSAHSSQSFKTKNTSPQKSSPLASSPPTNASEFDNNSGNRTTSSSSASPAPYSSTKNSRSPIPNRHHKTSSVTSSTSSNASTRYLKPEVVDMARKYRTFYPKYEALHRELANMRYRDVQKENDLLQMHDRLATMKRQINEGIVELN